MTQFQGTYSKMSVFLLKYVQKHNLLKSIHFYKNTTGVFLSFFYDLEDFVKNGGFFIQSILIINTHCIL